MSVEYFIQLLTYLIIYSIFGWILESVSKTIEQKKWVNSGFLNGPFCPIYGFGATIMILCLDSLKDKPILLFITAFIILSLWEYIVGVLLEKLFKTKYWDYSQLKFNIKGRVCLKNSIYWGILGVIFIRYVNPFIAGYIVQIEVKHLIYIDSVIIIGIIVDTIITIISTINLESTLYKLNDIGDNIKVKVEELKKLKDLAKLKTEKIEKNSIENIENIIKDLKIKQTKLKIKMYKHAIRIKKAFPSIKSETISKVLNQKIDLKKLKKFIEKK